MLYPRDLSLDSQLVWKSEEKQDQQDPAVPTVPIDIQEKIQPQANIENIGAKATRAASRSNRLRFAFLLPYMGHLPDRR